MRRFFFSGTGIILLVCVLVNSLFAQSKFDNTLTGKIVDSETGQPLFNVNVFLANTTRGAATGPDGTYVIENIPPGSYDLIVSMIGYELVKLRVDFLNKKTIQKDIRLVPKILSGEAVEIEAAEPKEWKKNLERFFELFVGETDNAKKCRIENSEVLDFDVNSKTGEFIASTDSILIVTNEGLGYRVRIILEKFRFCRDSLYYMIYPFYSELQTNDEKQKNEWLKNRIFTYDGSFRHFLSSLARGRMAQEYFELYRRGNELVTAEELNIVHSDTSAALKYLIYDEPLKVIFKGLSHSGEGTYFSEMHSSFPTSYVQLNYGIAMVDTFGNLYTKMGITRHGYWTRERIGDMLPFDFYPSK